MSLKSYNKAIEDYNVYIINDKTNYIAYIKRGESYAALNIYSAAIEDFSCAIKLNRNDARLFFDRGIFYMQNNDYFNAKKDFNLAILNNFDDKELVYFNLGIAEINLGNIKEACDAFSNSNNMAKEFTDKYCK